MSHNLTLFTVQETPELFSVSYSVSCIIQKNKVHFVPVSDEYRTLFVASPLLTRAHLPRRVYVIGNFEELSYNTKVPVGLIILSGTFPYSYFAFSASIRSARSFRYTHRSIFSSSFCSHSSFSFIISFSFV